MTPSINVCSHSLAPTIPKEPPWNLTVPRCKNSFKIAAQWNFCTPESCSHDLSSKCFDLIFKRLPQFRVSSPWCKKVVRVKSFIQGVILPTMKIKMCYLMRYGIRYHMKIHSSFLVRVQRGKRQDALTGRLCGGFTRK